MDFCPVTAALLQTTNLKSGAESYLKRSGLTDDEIAEIEAAICK